jgi:ubiquinone/menaquinone biosynthesis C-methylase UbiE
MDWYKKWFGKEYILVYPHRNESEAKQQIEFLIKHIHVPQNAKILDLCCGNGRHTLELKKLGYDVVGIDLSNELLEVARSKASEIDLDLKLVQCDMREIPYENYFDLVVQFFTSFGYFDSDAENQKVLSSISKALKPEGKFMIDYMNPDYVVDNLVEKDEKQISDGISVIQERWIENSRVNKKITMTKNDESSVYNESVRMYSLQEIKDMLIQVWLRLGQTYGDFDLSEYNQNSMRMILIGDKHT